IQCDDCAVLSGFFLLWLCWFVGLGNGRRMLDAGLMHPTDRSQEGNYSSIGASVCSFCDPGTFAEISGLPSCRACPTGKFTNDTGMTLCEDCPPGYYMNETQARACVLCPIGTYALNNGTITCRECQIGRYANVTGKTEW